MESGLELLQCSNSLEVPGVHAGDRSTANAIEPLGPGHVCPDGWPAFPEAGKCCGPGQSWPHSARGVLRREPSWDACSCC